MNNGLLYLGCFLALVLAALFGVPYAVDWNGYRGVFEEEASKVMGRDVRVGGGVSVSFLPTPYVRFEKVRLADTTGQTGEPFVRADSFTMRLAVSPLLRGAFEATDIELDRPVLSLVPDKEGSGNWASLQLRPAELPFIPQNVTLHSVRLIDGTLAVHHPEGGGFTRVEAINGELSAETLKGPFKFKGSGTVGGATRDIKFATFAADPDGTVRLKASLHGTQGDSSYLFDGAIKDFGSKPKVSGDLTGKLVLPAPRAADGAAGKDEAPAFDLKSTITADTRGAAFDAIELDLDSSGEPQTITGKATAQWPGEMRIDAAFTSKWLDLDKLAAPAGQQSTVSGLKSLFVTVMQGLGGGSGSTAVRLDVDQVKFGGEQAGTLLLDAERRQDFVTLRQLKSGLPGGARFELSGDIKGGGQGKMPSFAGEGLVRGVNFERAQAFAQRSGIDVDLKAQGPFWLAGRVDIDETRFRMKDAKAEIGGQQISGSVDIAGGDRKRVVVNLEGSRIDSAVFFPTATQHAVDVLRQAVSNGEAASGHRTATDADTSFHVTAAEFLYNGATYKDVDVSVVAEDKALQVNGARLTLPGGGLFEASGRINTGQGGKGSLSYEFNGTSKAALAEAAKISGLTEVLGSDALSTLPSLKIAGLLKLGQRGPASADVTFDGTSGEARVFGDAGFEGGFSAWKSAPVRFTATARGDDVSQVLSMLGTNGEALKGLSARPGEGTIAVSGLMSDVAKTYATINAEGLTATLAGTVKIAAGNTFAHQATGMLKARDAREAVALAGLSVPSGLGQSALEGPIAVSTADAKLTIATTGLKAAGSTLKGRIELAKDAGMPGRSLVDGEIEADRVSVAGLLSWVTDADPKAAAPADDVVVPVWPEAPFRIEPLSHVQGRVKLTAATLEVADDMNVREVKADLIMTANDVQLGNITGKAAGGPLTGTVRLAGGVGSVGVSASLKMIADLAALGAHASGTGELELSAQGRGLTPAEAVNSLVGKGAVKLSDARHAGPSAELVSDVSEAVLTGKLAGDPGAISSGLVSGLNTAAVNSGSRTIPFSIAAGDVRLDAYTIEGPEGRAKVTTTASLSKLLADSEWQVTSNAPVLPPPADAGSAWKTTPKGPLPAVSFVYTGRLADPGRMQIDVSVDDLARELAVRAMERKVEELEALRKRDEDRRKMEIDKRKQLELERQQAAAAAAAARAAERQRAAAPSQNLPPILPESNGDRIVPQSGLSDAPSPEASTDDSSTGAIKGAQPVPAASPSRVSVPKPQPRPQRRSTSDEATKAFGGWP